MLAMLFATYTIKGQWEYKDIPEMFRDDVDKILKAEGHEELIER